MQGSLYKILVVWAVCLLCAPSAAAQVSPVDVGRPSTVEPSGYGGQVVKDERPRSSLTFKALKVGQACDQAQIDRVLRQRQRIFAYCYERALARDPTLAGRLTLGWTVDAQGRVSAVEQGRATLKAPEVAACVEAQLERALFRGVVKGEALTCAARYRMTFASKSVKAKPQPKPKPKQASHRKRQIRLLNNGVIYVEQEVLSVSRGCEDDVLASLAAKQNAIKYCYEREHLARPLLEGEVTLDWTVAASGEGQAPAVRALTPGDDAVASCLMKFVTRTKFRAPIIAPIRTGWDDAQEEPSVAPPAECRVVTRWRMVRRTDSEQAREGGYRYASLELDALKVDARCDPARLERVMRQRQDLFKRCYEQALMRHPKLSGRQAFGWTILADGRVSRIKRRGATLKAPKVVACVEAQLKNTQFDDVVKEGSLSCDASYQIKFTSKLSWQRWGLLSRVYPPPTRVAMKLRAVDGPCDAADVSERTAVKVNAFRACYEDVLVFKSELAGEVTLGWTIEADGAAHKAAVTSTTLKDDVVEACLVRVAERLRFTQPGQLTVLPQGTPSDVPPAECRVEMKMTFSPIKP